MKLKEVDILYNQLAEEYEVPKPNYCVFEVKRIKKLDPINTKTGTISLGTSHNPLSVAAYGGRFVPMGKASHIILVSTIRGIRKNTVVHEFFHYLHWLKGVFPVKGAPDEEWKKEEKTTRLETNGWLKKNKSPPRKPQLGKIKIIPHEEVKEQ